MYTMCRHCFLSNVLLNQYKTNTQLPNPNRDSRAGISKIKRALVADWRHDPEPCVSSSQRATAACSEAYLSNKQCFTNLSGSSPSDVLYNYHLWINSSPNSLMENGWLLKYLWIHLWDSCWDKRHVIWVGSIQHILKGLSISKGGSQTPKRWHLTPLLIGG